MITVAVAALLAAAPSPEAEALGRRLAATGTLETLFPTVAAKETEEMIAQHPELSAAERQTLRDTAREVRVAISDRMAAAFGHEYAAALSLEDLRALIAFAETPASRRYRAAVPAVLMHTVAKVGNVDFGGDMRKLFCARTGKLCPR
jgi:hypothetical protein